MIARVVKGFVQSPLPGSQSQTQVRGLQTPLHMTVRITPASSDPPNTPRKQERTISCIRKYDPGNTESSTYVLNVLDTFSVLELSEVSVINLIIRCLETIYIFRL